MRDNFKSATMRFSLLLVTATSFVSCGGSSSSPPSSTSNSSDASAYLAGSCTLKEPGEFYDTCFMTRSTVSASADAKLFCESVAIGTYSTTSCTPDLFARTCEIEGTIKKSGQTLSETTINYYTKASTTKCLSPGIEKSISNGASGAAASASTTGPSPLDYYRSVTSAAPGTVLGSCTSTSTNYCYEVFSHFYLAATEKAYCLKHASQTWSDTGCRPDLEGARSPGQCKNINISDNQPTVNSYMYGWGPIQAQSFCNPRTLTAQKIIWVPN